MPTWVNTPHGYVNLDQVKRISISDTPEEGCRWFVWLQLGDSMSVVQSGPYGNQGEAQRAAEALTKRS